MSKQEQDKQDDKHTHLSRRERQIMDIVYEQKDVSAQSVLEHLPNPPSYSAVRAMLSKLEQKGHLQHREVGQKYIYSATLDKSDAQSGAIAKLVKTFFGGSKIEAASALLGMDSDNISDEDLAVLEKMIQQAKDKQQ
jgi:predicted transcriptional regulator